MKRLHVIIIIIAVLTGCGSSDSDGGFSSGSTGVGGSTARFAVNGDFLYIVDNNDIKTVNVSLPENPEYVDSEWIGWGIETIFGYKDNLFIGSQNGMFIYGINENGMPFYRSSFIHERSCDPVIANDNFAYVTTRSGNECGVLTNDVNRLTTIDITDLDNPRVLHIESMINPRGLAFFQGDLYVAEGEHGLKQFSLEDPSQPRLVRFYEDIAANDMIGLESTMIITRSKGIYQFGHEDEKDSLTYFGPIL